MVKALAPRLRRGSSWVWLWIVITSLVGLPAYAQTGEPKAAAPKGDAAKGKEAPAAAKGAPAAKAEAPDDDADGPGKDSGEIFKDPRAEKALPNTFAQLPYPTPRPGLPEATQVRAMAAGQVAAERTLLSRYIDMQVAELTNHANIRALIDPPANQAPNSAVARAIERATESLLAPLTIARSQQTPNGSFLAVYIPLLQTKLTPLLENHLIARIQASIVLGLAGSPNSLDLFLKELKDPNQVIWVKLWAARGLTNATQTGQIDLDAQKSGAVAAALVKILEDEENLPWPVQLRLLEAVGANRVASTTVIDRKGDVLTTVVRVLTESDARPDVRAWAAWSAGMLKVSTAIAKVNYALLTYHIGVLAAEIGDKIGAEYDGLTTKFEKNKGPATYLTGLLLSQVEPALAGMPNVRDSGIVNSAHPSASANKVFSQGTLVQVRNVSKAAVELIRAGGSAQIEARKALAAKVSDLRAFLQKNQPKDVELIPGGSKFPIAPAQVAGGRPAK